MTTYDRKAARPNGPAEQAPAEHNSAQPARADLKPRVPAGGPLTRLVQEAQRQPQANRQVGAAAEQGTNWTSVAQAITTKYHQLEGKVTPLDLLGAIRALPDGGLQDQVIGSVAGAHAEHVKRALRTPDSAAGPAAPLPRLRAAKTPQGGQEEAPTSGSTVDAASTTKTPAGKQSAMTPAATKAAVKGKINPARPPAATNTASSSVARKPEVKARTKGQVAAKKAASQRSAKPAAVPSGQAQGRTQSAAPAKQPQAGQPSVKATAAGKAGNLMVASRDDFRGLNVKLNPSMERAGKLVFSPASWRAAEKGVQQALKKREALQARKWSGLPQRQTAPRPPVQAKKPARVPSATIKAAEIKRHQQQNRHKNQAKLRSVVAKANQARAGIAQVQPRATAQISAAQKGAEAKITAALQKTLGQIRTAQTSAQARVTAQASAATARVTSAHQATVQGITQDTTQKITALKQSAQTLKTQFTARKAQMDAGVNREYTAASTKARSTGQAKAGSARATGQTYAARYRAEPLPEQNALQKLANGDDYYAKKRAARVQAALDVSNSYAGEMTKAGSDQASQIMQSLPDALASNQKVLAEYQKQLDKFLTTQVTALQKQRQTAVAQANQQRSALMAQINAQRSQALSGITQAAAQGRSQATSQASSQKQAVRAQARQAVQGVTSSVKQAQTQMQGRIQGLQRDMHGRLALDAPDFARAVSGFEKYAQQGGTQAQAQVTRTASTAAARVKAAAAPAAQALGRLGQGTASRLNAQATQAGAALNARASSGASELKRALTSHQQATKAALTSATKQFKSFGEGFSKDGEKIVKDVHTQLAKTDAPFAQALTGALDKEPGDIEAKASEAADAVQPRWKGILKIVIDVVIVIATIAATVALAAVLGPVGLVLAGMAIGALGAVVGQGLKDAVDGKFSGWGTYGAAALGGAIGGAFGGAGGAVGNVLAKGAVKGLSSGLAKGAMRVGVEGVVGTGFDLAGQVATGYTNQAVFKQPYKLSDTFNVKNVAMTGVMNTAGTALASPSVVKFVGGKLGNLNIPGKGLLGKFQNTLASSRPIRAINKLDAQITNSRAFTKASAGLEKVGERLGGGVTRGARTVRNGALRAGNFAGEQALNLRNAAQKGYRSASDWAGQKGSQLKHTAQDFAAWSKGKLNDTGNFLKGRKDALGEWLRANGKAKLQATVKEMALGALKKPGINQLSNFLFEGKFGNVTDIAKEAVEGGVKGAGKGAFKDASLPADAAPTRRQNTLKVLKDSALGAGSGVVAKFINNLTFSGRVGSPAEYLIAAIEGGLGGAGGRLGDLGSAALLKAVMKENTNRYVKVLGKFASESGLKSVFEFGMKNLANVANGNLFGSAYTWKNLLSGKEIFKSLANSSKFVNLGKDLLPLVKADLKRAGNALGDWKTQQWNGLKDHLNDASAWTGDKINNARTRLADFTGSQKAPVRMQENPSLLAGEARVTGHGEGNTTVEFGPNTSDAVKNAHATTARDLRAANGLPRKISDKLQELRGRTPSKGGSEKLRLEAEASKHQELATTYREAAQTFPEGSAQRQHYAEQAALADHYAREYGAHALKTDPAMPDTKGFVETRLQSGRKEALNRGYPEAPEGYQWAFYETGELKLVKLNKNSPTMDYIPGKNGQPGEFKIIDEATTPAQKGQSTTRKWDTDRLVTDENGQIIALRQKLDDHLQRRADAQKDIDRIKRLGENLTPQQIDELKAFEQQVREQSRILGEEAGKSYMNSRFPDGAAELIYPRDGVSASRSGDFDQVWQVKDAQGNLQIVVIEAKGGTSSLGRRRSDKGPGSEFVEQGSKEYFETIIGEMTRNKNANMRTTGEKVADAADMGLVEYLEVRAPIESKAVRLPNGDTEFTNTALDIKITPFIIR